MERIIKLLVWLAISALIIPLASTGLGAPSYGFNFTGGVGNSAKYITSAPLDAAGVVAKTNWNNLVASGNNLSAFATSANKTWTGLKNDAGSANSVTLTISGVNNGASSENTSDTNCVNGKLEFNYWLATASTLSGSEPQETNDVGITGSFSNLTANAYYDVYFYLSCDTSGSQNNTWGHLCLTNNGVVGTRYFFNVTPAGAGGSDYSCTGGFITGTDTNVPPPNAYPIVNYIKVAGAQVAADGTLRFIVTLEGHNGSSQATGFGVSGVQLVAVGGVSIGIQPANESVYTNGVGIFSVTPSGGLAPYTYQWYKVSGGATNAVSGATNINYTTPQVILPDSGTRYFVIITDALAATATSSQATLTVVAGSPDVISVQLLPDHWGDIATVPLAPTDKTGASPQTNWNTLTVDFPGDYQNYYSQTYGLADLHGIGGVEMIVNGASDGWHDNNPPPDSVPITKLLNTFVKVPAPASPGNNTLGLGLMQFTFTNLASAQTYNAYVYIEGDGSGEDPNIYAAGAAVTNYAMELISVNSNAVFTPSLNTDPAGTRDSGNYVHLLNITPVSGAITISAEVGGTAAIGVSGLQLIKSSADLVAASFVKQPSSQTVVTNAAVPFSVGALGYPFPTYQWYIISGGVTNAIVNATNSVYITPPATIAMNGNKYYCVASNTLPSSAASSQATLTVVAAAWDAISVQLEPSGNYGIDAYVQALSATNTTGAFAVSNWDGRIVSIIQSASTAQNFPLLKERNHGYGTPVQLTVLGVNDGYGTLNTNGNLFIPDSAPITRLLNTWVESAAPNYGGPGNHQFVFTNLDNSVTYDVYVYLMGDNYGGPNNYADVDTGTGVTHYTGPLFVHVNSSSNLVESVNTDPNGTRDSGNYVHLVNITPSSGAITVSVQYDSLGNGYAVGVCGLQLVNASVDKFAITIIQSPTSQRVLTNTPATFGVIATGNPINYQWYKVTGAVTNLLADATNRTYTTPLVTDAMTGTGYFVVLSNQFNGVTSSTAILTAGHLISPAPGLLENDEFNTGTFNSALVALETIYPTSPWLTTNSPDRVEYLTTFADYANLADNSAERIYGWFTPPVTTNYVFFIASDDAGVLWLSTNNSPTNLFEIAQNQAWMTCGNDGPTDWTLLNTGSGEYPNRSSGEWRSDQFELNGGLSAIASLIFGSWSAWPGLNVDGSIHLTAGTRYYIEMDHQQGGGGQGAAVTYKFAGAADPVAGDTPLFSSSQISTIQALDGNAIVITNQPQSVSVSSGNNATFSVVAGSYTVGSPAAPPLYYQWQEKSSGAGIFTDIPGATAQTYTTPLLSLGDSGSQFRVVLTTPGAQTNSAAATVTVTSLAPPVLSITRSGTNVVISWSPAGGTLWSSPVAGPSATWISLGTSQPYTAPLGSSNAFFRVTVP